MTFKIEAGKRYVAINGAVTGPLVAIGPNIFKCTNASIVQKNHPTSSQVWNADGTVHLMNDGESEHGLIAEYVEVGPAVPFPSGDVNDIVPQGYYSVKGIEANLPRHSGDGIILIPFPEKSDLYRQYLVQDGKHYVRHFLFGVWTSWFGAEGVIPRDAGSGAKGGIAASISSFERIAELEGINSSLEFQVFRTKQENADLSRRLAATEEQRKHFHDEWQKEKHKNFRPSLTVPGRHPRAFVFDAYRSFANGGTVGALSGDAERTLDKRIDNAFRTINRLQRELDDERSSTNARALFFGALAGVVVVAVAFGAHFVL